jgi:hypothetical protein
MTTLIIKEQVQNYNNWKTVFDSQHNLRVEYGEKTEHIYRENEHPNNMVIMLEWENEKRAKQFSKSKELKDALDKSGIIGKPNMYFVE